MVKTLISDEVYTAVKTVAAKGRLLSYQNYENLAESRDLEDLATKLRGTAYSQTVSKVQRPYKADKLEMAFREQFAFTHFSVLRVSPQSELLSAYYLRHIASNLKTVLKGKAFGLPYEEISRRVNLYAEELVGRRDVVVRALSAQGLDDAVRQLAGSEFGDEAEAAAKSFKEKNEPQLFDVYIDREFYSSLVRAYGSASGKKNGDGEAKIRRLITLDLDSFNILASLRAKLWDLPKPEARGLLIESGIGVPIGLLEDMVAAESVNEALHIVERTEYRGILPREVSGVEALSKLEDGFAGLTYERAQHAFLWDEFGVSLALALVKMLELEARNLSAIAFGVEQRLDVQRMMEKVVCAKERRS
ncbi:MAG: V-type ATPase subunit [Thaumarchaeota archaeon]|nr:V-type ATPase subunit [Nitrososphaerota archaeon]